MTIDEIAQRFWATDVRHGVQAPLTDDALESAQRALGHPLPEDLVRLLQIQNGGHVQDDVRAHPSPEPTSWATTWVPFDQCFGIGPDGLSLLDAPHLLREWGLPEELVLLSGDGHAWIALDYRSTSAGQPSVIFIDADSGQEVRLAPSFRAFVDGLMPPPADDEQ